jgi:ADP-ribose pyrophosphatase YjhB (NUDIX family)
VETRRIRPIAIGIIWRDRELLVQHGMDLDSGARFFRPPGGAIEFGERAADALRREFLEELQAQLTGVELLTVLENPFTYKGEAFHEIVFVFEARFVDARLYQQAEHTIQETNVQAKASWKALDDLGQDDAPLYPTGLIEVLRERLAGAPV